MKSTSLLPTQTIQMKKMMKNWKKMAKRRDFNSCTENVHYILLCPRILDPFDIVTYYINVPILFRHSLHINKR